MIRPGGLERSGPEGRESKIIGEQMKEGGRRDQRTRESRWLREDLEKRS
jgi:hypothetical protein